MLNSLFKILLFMVIVAAAAMGATYLLDAQNRILGNVMMTIAGTEYTFSPIQAVMALMVLVVLIWVFLKLLSLLIAVLKFINGDETAMSRYFVRNRERKGYQALSEGLLAIAAGDAHAAMSNAKKAESYLQKPALTNLLAAQAAEMAGDKTKAEQVYKALLQDPATKFVGLRGLLKQRLDGGDTDVALKLAEKAYALKPRHVETQDVLLHLQAKSQDWSGARKTLAAKLKNGSVPKDLHKRRDAVLALSQAKDVMAEGQDIEAREAAIEANKLSPDLVPAACLAARGYIADNKPKLAARVIKKAWQSQPHPDLAAVFSEIEPNETPHARLKRFAILAKTNPNHIETRLMMAELNLAAEDFPGARRALGDAVETDPDARVLTIMAAIERGEGADDTIVRGWLAKTLTARRGPSWVCDKCNTVHADWAPVCDSCDAFDTMTWRVPQSAGVATTTGLEMLPLLMGSSTEVTPPVTMPRDDIEDADVVEESAEHAKSSDAV